MDATFFEYHINALKEKYPSFNNSPDYHVFTLLCMKYFFIRKQICHLIKIWYLNI